MAHDPIVEEVRRTRDAFAKEHGYDISAIVRALQQQEVEGGRPLAPQPARRVPPEEEGRKAG